MYTLWADQIKLMNTSTTYHYSAFFELRTFKVDPFSKSGIHNRLLPMATMLSQLEIK